MNVFSYLKEDAKFIASSLHDTTRHYSEWPQEKVFKETQRELTAIENHFEKESLLTENLVHETEIKPLLKQAENERNNITSAIETLVMIHVDEPGFEQGLEDLTTKFDHYREFCDNTLYPIVRDHLLSSDLAEINTKFQNLVLGH